MQILSGLFPEMVMQRTAGDVCKQLITGRAEPRQAVLVKVQKNGRVVRGWNDVVLGKANTKGRFEVVLKGLPTGGAYTITLNCGDAQYVADDVLIGDVWVLAGQSNMEGIGDIKFNEDSHPQVRAFYMEDRWGVAQHPLHNLGMATVPAHKIISPGLTPGQRGIKSVGPGLRFAKTLQAKHDVPQGVIACAHGGTSMDQWKPSASTKTLFGAMMHRIHLNGGRVAGMAWYQGESDCALGCKDIYTKKMQRMVAALRKKVGNIPVAMVQLGSFAKWECQHGKDWDELREAQRVLPETISKLAVVPAIDLALDDPIHIGGDGHQILGERLAEAVDSVRYGARVSAPPIAVKNIGIVRDKRTNEKLIEITYKNVVGELQAPGRAHGFAVVTSQGDPTNAIYRTELHGNKVLLRLAVFGEADLQGAGVGYGLGHLPYCNITDAGGRSVPCFGPISLGGGKVYTSFPATLEKSAVLPGVASIEKCRLPTKKVTWSHVDLQQWYYPAAELRNNTDEELVYYRYRYTCDEKMSLLISLGADGPIKVWHDGKAVLTDAKAKPPILPDDQGVAVTAKAGAHEIIVALASKKDQAYGISLRLARTDKKYAIGGERPSLPSSV